MQPFTSLADVCEISTTEVTQMALKDAIQTQSMPAYETDEEHDTMPAEAPAVSAPAPEVAQAAVPAVAAPGTLGCCASRPVATVPLPALSPPGWAADPKSAVPRWICLNLTDQ